MSKSIVTEYDSICFVCGRESEAEHHLVFGGGTRRLAEEDGLKVPICNRCHNMGAVKEKIHDNPMAEHLSKMIGQLAWEKEYLMERMLEDEFKDIPDARQQRELKVLERKLARAKFQHRYGKSYL